MSFELDYMFILLFLNGYFCFRRPGGDRIYGVFDNQLPAALKKLPFDRHLSLKNVQKVVSEADGYQPHLIAPEQGYRRLIDGSISYFKGPAEASVDAVMFLPKLYITILKFQYICILRFCLKLDFFFFPLNTMC